MKAIAENHRDGEPGGGCDLSQINHSQGDTDQVAEDHADEDRGGLENSPAEVV